MTTFRVGQRREVMISNVGDATKEKELQSFDRDHDGVLQVDEAARYYADKTGGYRPESFDEVFKLVGGRQHEMRTVHQEPYGLGWSTYDWKGDFNVVGLGAGNIRTGRNKSYGSYNSSGEYNRIDGYSFLVDCNLMDKSTLEQNIKSATLVIGPRGFEKEGDSDLGEAVAVPLDMATRDSYQNYSRGGGSYTVPEQKYLGATVSTEDLRRLMGDSGGLSFYVRLETDQGTRYINRDGKAFSNFDIDSGELRRDDV